MMRANFTDRYGGWALIAGASDGLGAEFARELARRGMNCALVARRTDKLTELAEELRRDFGVEAQCHPIDLAAADAGARLDAVADSLDIGLLVLNAGGDTVGTAFLASDLGAWQALTCRNIDTLTAACHSFGARLAARKRGGVMVVGSDAAFGGAGRLSVYSASKAYALNLIESLWAELRPVGVDVAYLVIGSTDTPKMRKVLAKREISPESVNLAAPGDIARWALDEIGAGPTLVFDRAADQANALISPSLRRARVEHTTKLMDFFYG
jgi:short-subunit dehydrogenase